MADPTAASSDVHDVLIVSDLHLRGGHDNPTQGLYHFDEEFADFLRYYRLERPTGRPWRLVLGGDLIEFLYVTDMPDPTTPLLRGASFAASEFRYGAGTEAVKARWKLDVILRTSHPQLLLALARFLAEGNEIVVLRGNHDAEMVWPEVQEHLRRLIAEHHPADVGYLAMKDAVAKRLTFLEWFWLEPGTVYVEHGCQYDPFCSFEHFLYPVVPSRPTCIEMSIAELAIRYFTNQMKMINAMAAENIKSVSEYVTWVVRDNPAVLPRALGLYAGMVRRVLAKSGRPSAEAVMRVRREHAARVAAVDARLRLAPGTAACVDALRATPLTRSRVATVRFLALDLFAAAGLLALVVAAILLLSPARVGLLAIVGALAALGLLLYVGALRFQHVTDAVELERAADRLARLFGVRYVVFGHSHRAGVAPLPCGAAYVNVGTWVPEGEAAFFVYCAVTGSGVGRTARLWRWSKARRAPVAFAPVAEAAERVDGAPASRAEPAGSACVADAASGTAPDGSTARG